MTLMIVATILLYLLAVPAVLACGYLFILTLLSAALKPQHPKQKELKFDVIVPAHNESSIIAHTIASLKKIDWPKDRHRIVIVADNCTDDTAVIARAAGAEVLERHDTTLRGKGYALNYAFKDSAARGWADAVVVIDADAEVSTNILSAIAARLEQGAQAVQVHYGILNPSATWRTRLITIAKSAFHSVRSRARERLGVSCGIRGNGWCVTHQLLKKVPYQAFSLTEDVEYGIELGIAGYRVYYAEDAHSDAEMVSGEQAARKQRQRWEDGRFELIRNKTFPLLMHAFKQPSRVCLDLALDLMVLPLSYVVINIVLLTGLAALMTWIDGSFITWLWIGVGCVVALVLHVLRGWQLSGTGAQGLLDFAHAPGFLLWKLVLMLRRRESKEWVRTEREKRD
ncbi:MAG TPA: glycosyltransferase family 2 protein [Steroidobacteraceae bacterium]|nr:glycosyltransferase family 2 protein [Steroidobacteraceae bacterium]